MARVLSDATLRERMVEGAEQVARRRFRVEAMVEGTLAAYDALAPGWSR